MRELSFEYMVERGLRDAREGRVISSFYSILLVSALKIND
jgi:hypothetical protein